MVDTSLGGVRVVRELERLATERALPQIVVSDNGTELTSGAVLRRKMLRLPLFQYGVAAAALRKVTIRTPGKAS
jgi:putative transposase